MTEEIKTRTLELTVKDRFMIGELLPQESNLVDQLLARDIRTKTSISQQESTEIELVAGPGTLQWNEKKDLRKVVEFTEAELNFLDRNIKRRSAEEKIGIDMVEVILKIQTLVGK
jgi:hypothetical protein